MTWKDIWLSLANILVFIVLGVSAFFLDDPEEAMRRRVHALYWLGWGLLLLAFNILGYFEIFIPVGATP